MVQIICQNDNDDVSIDIDILDNGPGVSPEHQKKIFEPFFTTASGGTGLGLYIAHELARLNNAKLAYIDSADGGARFRLSLAINRNDLLPKPV